MVTWTVWKEGEYSNQMLGKQFHDASEGITTSFGKISKISGESKETPIRGGGGEYLGRTGWRSLSLCGGSGHPCHCFHRKAGSWRTASP